MKHEMKPSVPTLRDHMERWKTVKVLPVHLAGDRALLIPAGETIDVVASQELSPRVFWRGCREALGGLQVNASDLFVRAQWIGQAGA